MASTYSTNLAIELIGTGDQAGTWGVTTNTNLGTLIEQAISGYVTQAVSTGADTTITIPNGSTGVARNMYIELTGTGGTNTNLIVPSNKKLYFVFNNTASGQVTVKVSGQTGVSVPNGKKMILVSNGTDIVNGVNYIQDFGTNSFTVTNLVATSATITNLIATTASVSDLSATVLRSASATLTHLSATSASITNLALTSLTISSLNITNVTVASATVSSNLTLSAGTANGVLYLNGSKVATSGSALTFDGSSFLVGATSAAAGKAVIKDTASSNTLWLIGRTSDGASSVSFRNAADSAYNARLEGVSGQLIFEANGSEQMRLTSTGLGIGTSSPAYNLSIVSSGATATLNLKDSGTADGGRIRIRSQSENLEIITGGGVTATFNSAQNLGLGVTPSAWGSQFKALEAGDADSQSFISFNTNANAVRIGTNNYFNGTNTLYKFTGTAGQFVLNGNAFEWQQAASGTAGNAISFTQAMTLDANGYLGIGTTNPSASAARLVVSKASGVIASFTNDVDADFQISTASTATTIGCSTSTPLIFKTGNAERARIDAAGNFGLGVTPSAWRSTDVAFQARRASLWDDNNNAMYLGQNVYENTSGNYIYIGSDYASAYRQQDGTHAWFYAASGTAGNTITFTQAMTLDASGNLGIGTSSPSNLLTINKNNADAVHLRSADTNYSSLGLGVSTSAGYTYIQSTNSGSGTIQPLTFWVGNSERARITSGGDLLVATSDSAETTGPGLKLIYSTTIPKYRVVHDTATSGETSFVSYNVNATNNGYRFYVTVGGTINAINTTISAISDQRLKENVCDLDVGLDAIMSLKPRKFDWKEGKGKDIKGDRGFIAQEFEQVFPDLVDEWKDPAPEGEEPYKSVRQDLIPVLVKAIQEQQAMINDLKAKVAALESK